MLNRRNYIVLTTFVVAGLLIWQLPGLLYFYRVYTGQNKLQPKLRPVAECLSDSLFSVKVKSKIKLIEDVKKFAQQKANLKSDYDYNSYLNLEGKRLMYKVYACKPYTIQAIDVNIPFYGFRPYKIFYNKSSMVRYKAKLAQQGSQSMEHSPAENVFAFMRPEPITSDLVSFNEPEIVRMVARTIIRRNLHNSYSLTEQANIIAYLSDELAGWFLMENMGPTHPTTVTYLANLNDYRLFSDYIVQRALTLELWLNKMPNAQSKSQMFESYFNRFNKETIEGLTKIKFNFPELYHNYFYERGNPNLPYYFDYVYNRKQYNYLRKQHIDKYNGQLTEMIKACQGGQLQLDE